MNTLFNQAWSVFGLIDMKNCIVFPEYSKNVACAARGVLSKRAPGASCCGYDILLSMQITLAYVGARPNAKDGFDSLTQTYLDRCAAFARCQAEAFKSEEALLEWLGRQQGRTPAVAVLLDSRGKQMTSEAFAAWLGARRDEGAQHLVFAIGPASGWSDTTRQRAHLLLSLGPLTLAHALARLVMAEQLYRAFAILSGHPYHAGH